MSSETMPVMMHANIRFKMFMTDLETVKKEHEVLMPWVDVMLSWAYKYYKRMDDNDIYVVTMCECLRSTLVAHSLYLTQPSPQPHDMPDMD